MQTRDPKDKLSTSLLKDVSLTLTQTSLAVFATNPVRYAMNIANKHETVFSLFAGVMKSPFNAVSANLIRGTCATGSQLFFKAKVQQQYGFSAGLTAAITSGTLVATFIETGFIRMNNKAGIRIMSPAFFRFRLPLSGMYCGREVGFCLSVLAKKDLSPVTQHGVTFAAAGFTAICHKLAVAEATRDFLPKGMTTPNFHEGIFSTLRNLAYGRFTDPRFNVVYPNPTTNFQLLVNFSKAGCGWPMFTARLLYLESFGYLTVKIPEWREDAWKYCHAKFFTKKVVQKDARDMTANINIIEDDASVKNRK